MSSNVKFLQKQKEDLNIKYEEMHLIRNSFLENKSQSEFQKGREKKVYQWILYGLFTAEIHEHLVVKELEHGRTCVEDDRRQQKQLYNNCILWFLQVGVELNGCRIFGTSSLFSWFVTVTLLPFSSYVFFHLKALQDKRRGIETNEKI